MILLSNLSGIDFRLSQNRKKKIYEKKLEYMGSKEKEIVNHNLNQNRESSRFEKFLNRESEIVLKNINESKLESEERNFVYDYIQILDYPLQVKLISF